MYYPVGVCMRLLEGQRVAGTKRVGHAGIACAVAMFALLVPYVGQTPANFQGQAISGPDARASAPPVAAASPRSRFVSYNGVRATVPATWPVTDLRLHPRTCVRSDQAGVYLGSPGTHPDCPAHAVGRTDTVWLRTVSGGRRDPLTSHEAKVGALAARVAVDLLGHDKQAQFLSAAVELEATWGANSSSVDKVLASAVKSSGPSGPAPTTSALAATETSDTSLAAAQPVSFTAATSAAVSYTHLRAHET